MTVQRNYLKETAPMTNHRPALTDRPVRLALLTSMVAAIAAMSGCGKTMWRPDLGGAMRLAAEQNRVVVVAYWSTLNPDCARMDRKVFSNKDVQASLMGTIPVRVSSMNKSFAKTYGLTTVPSFVVLGPGGRVLGVRQGYMDEGRFRGFVERAKLSM